MGWACFKVPQALCQRWWWAPAAQAALVSHRGMQNSSMSVGCEGTPFTSPRLGVWVLPQGWGQPRRLHVAVERGCCAAGRGAGAKGCRRPVMKLKGKSCLQARVFKKTPSWNQGKFQSRRAWPGFVPQNNGPAIHAGARLSPADSCHWWAKPDPSSGCGPGARRG